MLASLAASNRESEECQSVWAFFGMYELRIRICRRLAIVTYFGKLGRTRIKHGDQRTAGHVDLSVCMYVHTWKYELRYILDKKPLD
jgi:hypothetical protein